MEVIKEIIELYLVRCKITYQTIYPNLFVPSISNLNQQIYNQNYNILQLVFKI